MRRSASNAESDGGGGGWQAGGGSGPSTGAPPASSDDLVLLLSVSIISACCLCWFLEHLDYLLRPLVFAVGLSLILRPFVDFASDWRYQQAKLRRWNVQTPWHPRVVVVPRALALVLALSLVMLVSATFIWALYLSEQWIVYHWKDKSWNDRFIDRVNDLADFTDRIALRLLKRDDFALASWHTLQSRVESTLKDETFWTQFANNLFGYLGDAAVTMFYVLFLLAPPRVPTRLRSQIVRRIHGAVKKFVLIMVALSAVRATMVGTLIYACGVPGSLAGSIAIVSFWLFFIPNLGSVVATAIPLPLIVLLPDLSNAQRWCALFVPAFGSFVVGDILGPTVYRRGLGLNEVVILLSLVFWFSVWGGIGAVLAVPIMCAVRISLEEIPHRGTHALARMMAPVTPWRAVDRGDNDDVSDTASDVTGGGDMDDDARRRSSRAMRYRGRRFEDFEDSHQTSPPRGWLLWAYDSVTRSGLFGSNRGAARGGNAPDAGDDGVVEGPREPLLPPSQAPPPRARAPGLGSTM